MKMNVESLPGNVTVIEITERLDLHSATEAKQKFAKVVSDGHCRLVVDLSRVTFLDSSGLGILVAGLKAARLAGGDLRIARPPEQVRLVLELTTLDRVLRPYATVEEALAAYQ